VERYYFEWSFESNLPVSKIQVNLVDGSMMNATLNSGGNDYSLLYFARNASVSVFAAFTSVEAHGMQMNVVRYNDIAFIGEVASMYVSPNSMHLFAAVRRAKWELDSQQRYVEICTKIAADPLDPFLAPEFRDACESEPPQDVNLNAFTQYVSYCQFNLYCPSLTAIDVRMPPPAHYADRPAVAKICPPGYFCLGGGKTACPQGFFCPDKGMILPRRCPLPVNSNATCSFSALLVPAACPEGTFCTLTHIPGIPAPPGFMVPPPPSPRNDFLPCADGQWCVLGAYATTLNTSASGAMFNCPMNTFCGNASVLQPTICACDSSGFIVSANDES
jgi:hypothetical protein